MERRISTALASLDLSALDAVEVSGSAHRGRPWRSYTGLEYPEFDLLRPHDVGRFDVVICEQVLEHVTDPLTAIGNLARLGRPGALVLITTPFLIRVHPQPIDFWRFTPDGLRALIEAQGLTVTDVGSWGNKWCVLANHGAWRPYLWRHRVLSRWTLRDDAASPQMVWAFARVPHADAGQGES